MLEQNYKQSKNRGLSGIDNRPGPGQIDDAIRMYEQAQMLASPPSELLSVAGLTRDEFNDSLDRIDQSRGPSRLNIREAAPDPVSGTSVGMTSLLGGVGGAMLGSTLGGGVGTGIGAASGGALGLLGAALVKADRDQARMNVLNSAKILKEYGVLDSPTFERAKPILHRKENTRSKIS